MTRQRLTKFEYAVIYYEQDGKCGCGCGEPLEEGKIDEEHTICNYFKPGKPDSLWIRDCHKRKTAMDKKDIAKCKRLRGETKTGPKKSIPSRKLGGGRYKQGFDGKVRAR